MTCLKYLIWMLVNKLQRLLFINIIHLLINYFY